MKTIAAFCLLIHQLKTPPRMLCYAFKLTALGLGIWGLLGPVTTRRVQAYPPAPHHLLYGMVRDELGNPLMVTNAEVMLETLAGAQLQTTIIPNLSAGINYRLAVPMDAGLTSDAYKPNALRPTAPFRLKVKIGQTIYLPMEASANYANLGKPAQRTRLDLTLGEDTDGDGIPDAWERMLMAMLGEDLALQDIRPDGDADGDGLTNLQEYLAGTYAFDPQDGFRLDLVGSIGPNAVLEFMVLRGRNYAVLGSTNLQNWLPLEFRVVGDALDAPTHSSYQATDVRVLQVEALSPEGQSTSTLFYKAQVQ